MTVMRVDITGFRYRNFTGYSESRLLKCLLPNNKNIQRVSLMLKKIVYVKCDLCLFHIQKNISTTRRYKNEVQ